ncbi:MAG: CAP domain-containing protein, partial [Alphaproteobacteria bacterium]|nr:CAP domain-containing protein [Alphaproteobacteria bacterium]
MRAKFHHIVISHLKQSVKLGAILLALGWGLPATVNYGHAQETTQSTSDSQAILNYVNEWRVKAGRPPLLWFPLIDQAARAHSQYLWDAHNGEISHSESNRASGYFRGQHPQDRVKLLYPQAQVVGEVLGVSIGNQDAIGVIQG